MSMMFDLQSFLNGVEIVDAGFYSYINQQGTDIGYMYILDSDNWHCFDIGEYICIESASFDIDEFIVCNNLVVVSVDNVVADGVILYVLYSDALPQYRILDGKKYNMQVAVRNDVIKLGYPAIFDSF